MIECKIRFLLTFFTWALHDFNSTCRFNMFCVQQLPEHTGIHMYLASDLQILAHNILATKHMQYFLHSHARMHLHRCTHSHTHTNGHTVTHIRTVIWLNMSQNIACCFRSHIFITPHPLLVYNATLLPQLLSSISGNRARFLLSRCVCVTMCVYVLQQKRWDTFHLLTVGYCAVTHL